MKLEAQKEDVSSCQLGAWLNCLSCGVAGSSSETPRRTVLVSPLFFDKGKRRRETYRQRGRESSPKFTDSHNKSFCHTCLLSDFNFIILKTSYTTYLNIWIENIYSNKRKWYLLTYNSLPLKWKEDGHTIVEQVPRSTSISGRGASRQDVELLLAGATVWLHIETRALQTGLC